VVAAQNTAAAIAIASPVSVGAPGAAKPSANANAVPANAMPMPIHWRAARCSPGTSQARPIAVKQGAR